MNYSNLLNDAVSFAKISGDFLLHAQSSTKIAKKKTLEDFSTTADIASEKKLIKFITKAYPGHNILTEESGYIDNKGEYTWVIDPLDNTKEYFRGLPQFNIFIAVEHGGKLVVGVMYSPEYNQLYSCYRGGGVQLNGKSVSVSTVSSLTEAIVSTHLPAKSETVQKKDLFWKQLVRLTDTVFKTRATFDDGITLGWIAQGGYDGFFSPFAYAKWWDLAPGILMVEEAGGIVTDFNGNSIRNRDVSHGIVASNGKIHKQVLNIIEHIKT